MMSPDTHFFSPPNPSPAVTHMAEEAPGLRPKLWTASSYGWTELVRQLLAEEVDIEEKGGQQETTPLHEAAVGGHEQISRLLLEHHADVSALETDGSTPLMEAAMWGHETVARLLIEHQADVSAKDANGGTALHFAACTEHETVVRLLLDKGADEQMQMNGGETALWCAAYIGQETVVRLLLDKGANEQTQSNDGHTPEDVAVDKGYHQIAAMLKAAGVRRTHCVAFAMGHHERLGGGSPVLELDAGVLRMVLEQV